MRRTTSLAAMVSQQLSQNALAVCRHYLPAGRREGHYWMVGNVAGDPGRSLYVRLLDSDRGKAGNWVDAATGEHGDLLDLIHLSQHCAGISDAIHEAERFLGTPRPFLKAQGFQRPGLALQPSSSAAAQRLFAASRPITGTLAARYLRSRGITQLDNLEALRFHPHCYYRASAKDNGNVARAYPAVICAVTDDRGYQTGAHRTWLDRSGTAKARVASPRRALGHIAGQAIRIGTANGILMAGEGLETMLSIREALPGLPVQAATSANHLSVMSLPAGTVRLYVARDRDSAGDAAFATLTSRTQSAGIEIMQLMPRLGDFNDDLIDAGPAELARWVLGQLHCDDVERFGPR
ncbi:toprim domain-containing protein [Blastomonas sp. AAP53]|uniref:DUF7146 domain-containing protein n=1 Tax=Blastomonas sp. AAP53 TaxID=1248760 RepID=UPI0003033F6B|nr:toprim domain-containing protein [Blastomonas sp. AAP53]